MHSAGVAAVVLRGGSSQPAPEQLRGSSKAHGTRIARLLTLQLVVLRELLLQHNIYSINDYEFRSSAGAWSGLRLLGDSTGPPISSLRQSKDGGVAIGTKTDAAVHSAMRSVVLTCAQLAIATGDQMPLPPQNRYSQCRSTLRPTPHTEPGCLSTSAAFRTIRNLANNQPVPAQPKQYRYLAASFAQSDHGSMRSLQMVSWVWQPTSCRHN